MQSHAKLTDTNELWIDAMLGLDDSPLDLDNHIGEDFFIEPADRQYLGYEDHKVSFSIPEDSGRAARIEAYKRLVAEGKPIFSVE